MLSKVTFDTVSKKYRVSVSFWGWLFSFLDDEPKVTPVIGFSGTGAQLRSFLAGMSVVTKK